MKSRKKLIVSLITLCITAIIAVGAVSLVAGLTQATATATLSVSYTAAGQINANVATSYTVGEYGTDLIDSQFTNLNDIYFYPTSTSSTKTNSVSSPTSLNAWNYYAMKFQIRNNRTDNGFIMVASPSITSSNIKCFYATSQRSTNIVSVATDGSFTSPTVTALSSGSTEFVIANGQTKTVYLLFAIDNPDNSAASLTNVSWDFSLTTAEDVRIDIIEASSTLGTTANTNRATPLAGAGYLNPTVAQVDVNPNLILKDVLSNYILSNPTFASNYSCWFTTNSCNEYIEDWDCLGSLVTGSSPLPIYTHSAITTGLSIDSDGVVTKSGTPTGDIYLPFTAKSIYGTGLSNGAFANCSGLTNIYMPSTITSIGIYTFRGCTSLTSITIPSSVTSIGSDAFSNCTSLTSITISSSVTSIGGSAFSYCSSLTNIIIPEGVKSIGTYIFRDCSNLTSITIPSTITSIGDSAFYGCRSLANITIPSSITSIGEYAFYNCSSLADITIPSSVTNIGNYAFQSCRSLTNITIPSGVISIGNYAFGGCLSLTAINVETDNLNFTSENGVLFNKDKTILILYPASKTNTQYSIPSSVNVIRNAAFSNCSNLKSVTIPSSVNSIGTAAFSNCSKLISITIPNNVTSLGDNAFQNCKNLSTVTIGSGVKYILSLTFSGCSNLTSVTMSSGLTSIGTNAFQSCINLTNITIPNSVIGIGDYAFASCSSLTSITIPEGVKSIGYSTFRGCTRLTSVTIPSSVNSIGSYAFYNCRSLTSIIIPSSVTSIGSCAFQYCINLTSVTFENTNDWWVSTSSSATSGTSVDVTNPTTNATNLISTYRTYYWKCS